MSQDPSPFAGTAPVASLAHSEGAVTLVEGQSFCLSGRRGDVSADLPHGLFLLDTRVLSRWELRVNGHPVEPLTVDVTEPFAATFVGRATPAAGRADADVVVFRYRNVGAGMRERIVVTNHGLGDAPIVVELRCDVDFADLFAVKESRVHRRGEHVQEVIPPCLRFTHRDEGETKVLDIRADEAALIEPGLLTWRTTLPPRGTSEICVEVAATFGGERIEPRFRCGGQPDGDALPARRLETWRAALPGVGTDHAGLAAAVHRAGEDLGALRIFDPDHPDVPILAAGAPWFMTVFGRDSLLTAWMTLLADPTLARGVLETLARFQGADVNPVTEEEPGKILHEMRFGAAAGGLALGGGDVYYGSIDATPLFVMLLGELRRWDLADDIVEQLLPHADRALAWISEFGDRDGDGYVEYERANDHGMVNQGWKDSWDAVRDRDGELAWTPIALCEVQGYVYAAYVARAHFAREAGDTATFERYRDKASDLRRRFNEDFWLDEHAGTRWASTPKRPIDALASNMGQCLWTGIIDPDRAGLVAARLMSDELFSGWGVRTLATSMKAYNPVSYHNGSVWPHDNALCAAGLARYGYVEEAHRIIGAQLQVAEAYGGRLPELFAGFERGHLHTPAAYPTSCSPQAWAAAAPLLWLRTLLRFDPWAPRGQVNLDPQLPPWLHRLRVDGIAVAGQRLTVAVEHGRVEVTGTGQLEIVTEPRTPLTATFPPDAG